MLKLHATELPDGVLHDEIAAQVTQLFTNAAATHEAEQLMTTQIAALVQELLSASEISSDVPFHTLVQQFGTGALPEDGRAPDSYLDEVADSLLTHTMHTSSPRFIGHMTSALPYFMRPLAHLLTAMNQNVVKLETSKVLSLYERQVLAMMHRLIYGRSDDFYRQHSQNPVSTLGMIASGGTLANITALWCARNAALRPSADCAGIEKLGFHGALRAYGYSDAVIVGSSLMHYSFEKAADVLGIGTHNLIKVAADRHNAVDIAALRRTIAECQARGQLVIAVIGVAGTTDSGGLDALDEIAAIAEDTRTHFHVDAAWGGPLLFSEQHRHKLRGIERADSVTIDGHKQMYLPMGIGMVFLRDPHLAAVVEKQARYIVRPGSIDLGKRTLEGSRPGMALFLHAALHIIGRRGYAFLIDEGMRKTQYMAAAIRRRPEFELLADPAANILLYRFIPERWRADLLSGRLDTGANEALNQVNEQLQKVQRQAGSSFVSRTTTNTSAYGADQSIVALRAVLANPLTTEADIDAVLDDQLRLAAQISAL